MKQQPATFEFQHMAFAHRRDIRGVDNLPEWITRKSQEWFLIGYVLTLDIGDKIESDFHVITRLS